MIQAKEIDGELWIKAADFHKAIKDAQRPWVGLTDEDCDEVERWVEFKEEGSDRIQTSKLVRYIEAKLKERNHG